jgi:hypothetical protein
MIAHLWWWIEVHTGTTNEPGPYYAFFSGFGSDIGQVTLVAAIIGAWRSHTCHVRGCWRFGRHPVKGTTHVVCRKHHPDDAPTADDVLADHRRANR